MLEVIGSIFSIGGAGLSLMSHIAQGREAIEVRRKLGDMGVILTEVLEDVFYAPDLVTVEGIGGSRSRRPVQDERAIRNFLEKVRDRVGASEIVSSSVVSTPTRMRNALGQLQPGRSVRGNILRRVSDLGGATKPGHRDMVPVFVERGDGSLVGWQEPNVFPDIFGCDFSPASGIWYVGGAPSKPLLDSTRRWGLSEGGVADFLRDLNLYDKKLNPGGTGLFHMYEIDQPQRAGSHDVVIVDHATGLKWQQAGSAEAMTWAGAEPYIKNLNKTAFGGCREWRAPTLQEAASLLEPKREGRGLYISPLFDTQQRGVWTGDRRNRSVGWVVELDLGYCVELDLSSIAYVRAVCSR